MKHKLIVEIETTTGKDVPDEIKGKIEGNKDTIAHALSVAMLKNEQLFDLIKHALSHVLEKQLSEQGIDIQDIFSEHDKKEEEEKLVN